MGSFFSYFFEEVGEDNLSISSDDTLESQQHPQEDIYDVNWNTYTGYKYTPVYQEEIELKIIS